MRELSKVNADAIPAPLAALENAEILHDKSITPEEMKDNVITAAGEIFA